MTGTTPTKINTALQNCVGTTSYHPNMELRNPGLNFNSLTFKFPLLSFVTGSGNDTEAQTVINNLIYNTGFIDYTTDLNAKFAFKVSCGLTFTYSYGSEYSEQITSKRIGGFFSAKGLNEIKTISDISLDSGNIVVT